MVDDEMRRAAVLSALVGLLASLVVALPADAASVTATWRVSMHSKTDTGGVCHLTRKNEFVGGAKIIEKGDPQEKWRLRFDYEKDRVSGVMCWQPKDYCFRVYEKWPLVGWVRVHRYWSRDKGRDAWLTISTSEAGSRLKLLLTKGRCPKQPRLV